MRCNKCGHVNPDDAKYCINCGRELENPNEKICPKCGAKNYADSVFCSECGNMLEYKKEEQTSEQVIAVKEKMNPYAWACLIVAIAGAAVTLFAVVDIIAVIGLTISTVALVMIAIGLLKKAIKGNIKFAIGIAIYGVLGNIIWLAFLIWMLPNF